MDPRTSNSSSIWIPRDYEDSQKGEGWVTLRGTQTDRQTDLWFLDTEGLAAVKTLATSSFYEANTPRPKQQSR